MKRFDQELMFARQYTGLKRCRCVVLEHWHPTLRNDGALIVLLTDNMNRHPRYRVAGRQYGLVHGNAVPTLSAMRRQ